MENRTSFWTVANRPIVVLIVGLTAWPFVSSYAASRAARQNVGGVARGIRDAIDELSDAELHGEFKRIASGIVSQITEGFQAALSQSFGGSSDRPDPIEEFRQLAKSITISDIGRTTSQFKGRESWVAKVKNGTAHPLHQVHVAASFYRSDGTLVDAVRKWVSEIKVLEPGQEVAFRLDRTLGSMNDDPKEFESFVADRVEMQIGSFMVHRPKKED